MRHEMHRFDAWMDENGAPCAGLPVYGASWLCNVRWPGESCSVLPGAGLSAAKPPRHHASGLMCGASREGRCRWRVEIGRRVPCLAGRSEIAGSGKPVASSGQACQVWRLRVVSGGGRLARPATLAGLHPAAGRARQPFQEAGIAQRPLALQCGGNALFLFAAQAIMQ